MRLPKIGKGKTDRPIVSINIGNDFISLIKGIRREGKICILDFACRKDLGGEKTPDLISRQIYELLTSVLHTKQIKKLRIHSIISSRKLCIRVIRMPVMPASELSQAIRSRIFKYVSPDVDEVVFRFSVLGEIREKDVKKIEVVFAAIQKSLFDEYLQSFKLIDIEPNVITSACFSDWNLVRQTGLDKGAASVMLVDIESQNTDLTIYKDNRLVFTRNISIGSGDFTDILKSQPQLPLEKPEDIELLWGLGKQSGSLEGTKADTFMEIRKRLQNEAEILRKEIELTIQHYYQITHGNRVDKCLLLGVGSQMKGLVDFLKQRLEIPTEELDIPDDKLELPIDKREEFERDLPFYTQALGALLVGPDDINFAPETGLATKKFMRLVRSLVLPGKAAKFVMVFTALGIIVVLFPTGLNLYYKYQIGYYTKRRDVLQNQTLQLMDIKRRMDTLDFEKKLYLELIKQYPAYSRIIAEICKAIPAERLVLDELNFSGSKEKTGSQEFPPIKFTAIGRILGEDVDSSGITGFVSDLEKSGYFENLKISIQKRVSPGDYSLDRERGGGSSERESAEGKVKGLNFVIEGFIKTK